MASAACHFATSVSPDWNGREERIINRVILLSRLAVLNPGGDGMASKADMKLSSVGRLSKCEDKNGMEANLR